MAKLYSNRAYANLRAGEVTCTVEALLVITLVSDQIRVTTTLVKPRLNCDSKFVMKGCCRKRPLW